MRIPKPLYAEERMIFQPDLRVIEFSGVGLHNSMTLPRGRHDLTSRLRQSTLGTCRSFALETRRCDASKCAPSVGVCGCSWS